DQLLVVRSLTKTWGLAGLRAGYVIGDPALIARLAALQSPWSVSSLAASVMVATATPEALAEAERGAMQQRAWREILVAGLSNLGLRPIPGVAPFVLVRVGAGVRAELRTAGCAVRRCDTFPGLDDTWIRIAARAAEAVDPLLEDLAPLLDAIPFS
ncbi:MAG: aminotransferase class I/II-fold pyridoxal phosphate-dependent enzyme, partial [Microbacteriaceae bacterium]